jgi:hypothetical protein
MNIITAEQWAEWRLSPVTQEFLKYIKMKKEDIARQKIDMISGPAENINPYTLSVMNGIEQACNGIIKLDLPTMTEDLKMLEDITRDYRKMMKEALGVDL